MNFPTPLRLLLLRISPPCDEITLLVSKAHDTRLTLRERWRLQFHFVLCNACRRFNIQLHALHAAVHDTFAGGEEPFLAQTVLPEAARERIQTAITKAMDKVA
jgi:hypothetical protein